MYTRIHTRLLRRCTCAVNIPFKSVKKYVNFPAQQRFFGHKIFWTAEERLENTKKKGGKRCIRYAFTVQHIHNKEKVLLILVTELSAIFGGETLIRDLASFE